MRRLFSLLLMTKLVMPLCASDHESLLSHYHALFTRQYRHLLQKIDAYFSDTSSHERFTYDRLLYDNRIETVFSFQYREHRLRPNLYLRGHIVLPRTSKKLELVFSRQTTQRLKNQAIDPEYERGVSDQRVNVGLKYYFFKKSDFALYSKIGMRLNLAKLDLYAKVGAERLVHTPYFNTILSADLYHYLIEEGFIATGDIDFVKHFSDTYTLEQDNRIVWREDGEVTTTEHTLRLYHFYDRRNRFEYWISLLTRDDDRWNYCSDTYTAALKYHHDVNGWLFYEIIPQLYRSREEHFTLQRAISVNFGLLFGG